VTWVVRGEREREVGEGGEREGRERGARERGERGAMGGDLGVAPSPVLRLLLQVPRVDALVVPPPRRPVRLLLQAVRGYRRGRHRGGELNGSMHGEVSCCCVCWEV
jgi:hypothetical protein